MPVKVKTLTQAEMLIASQRAENYPTEHGYCYLGLQVDEDLDDELFQIIKEHVASFEEPQEALSRAMAVAALLQIRPDFVSRG